MEPEDELAYSKDPATAPYSEPHKFNPRPRTLFSQDLFQYNRPGLRGLHVFSSLPVLTKINNLKEEFTSDVNDSMTEFPLQS